MSEERQPQSPEPRAQSPSIRAQSLFDVAVIGAGPGGYVAAIRAAQHGLKTVLIEKERLGGECLNHGCIPSKALIHVAEAYAGLSELKAMGVTIEAARVDWRAAVSWKDRVVKRLITGIASLLKANGVTLIEGEARFVDSHMIEVGRLEDWKAERLEDPGKAGSQPPIPNLQSSAPCIIKATATILATGSKPVTVPGLPFDGQAILDSRAALALPEAPPRLIVIGGGYIGLELATVFASLGSRVTIVEMLDGLLPLHSRDAVKIVERGLRRLKVKAMLKTKAVGLEITDGVARLQVREVGEEKRELGLGTRDSGFGARVPGPGSSTSTTDSPQMATPEPRAQSLEPTTLEAEKILVTVGRKPFVAGLGLENTKVTLNDRGFVSVDAQRRTTDAAIFAIGDLTPGPALAHKASAEALVAADTIAGKAAAFDVKAIPSVAFTSPEVASVGLSLAEAETRGIAAAEASFPYLALGRALTMGASDGYFKWIFRMSDHVILGAEIVGHSAGNVIGEAALAVENGLTLEAVSRTIHPHPTLSEGLHEAAELGLGWPVHLPRK